jgi:hypothetical protein
MFHSATDNVSVGQILPPWQKPLALDDTASVLDALKVRVALRYPLLVAVQLGC